MGAGTMVLAGIFGAILFVLLLIGKQREGGEERNPRFCHEHRPGTRGRDDRGTSRTTCHSGTMKEEAENRTERREEVRSDGGYRGVTVTTDQPPPATGAGPDRQTVKGGINSIMPALI